MKKRSRQNAGNTPWVNDDGVWVWARKRKRRKGRYLRGWMGRGKRNRDMINRQDRHVAKQALRQEEA